MHCYVCVCVFPLHHQAHSLPVFERELGCKSFGNVVAESCTVQVRHVVSTNFRQLQVP